MEISVIGPGEEDQDIVITNFTSRFAQTAAAVITAKGNSEIIPHRPFTSALILVCRILSQKAFTDIRVTLT